MFASIVSFNNLNVLQVVMTYASLPEYITVADVFVDYILQYCTVSFRTGLCVSLERLSIRE